MTTTTVGAYAHLYGEAPHVGLFNTGSVSIRIGELTVFATDPAHLLVVAEAFTDAARTLSDELDKAAAREMNAERVPA